MKFKNRADIIQNLDLIKKKLATLGYVLIKQLGEEESSWGVAYTVGGKKVLKITADSSELETCANLKTKKLKHVVSIYRVFQFHSLPGVGFILEEELEPLSSRERSVVEKLEQNLRGTDTAATVHFTAQNYKLNTLDDLKAYMAERLYIADDPEMVEFTWNKKKLNNIAEQWSNLSSSLRAFIALALLNDHLIATVNDNLDIVTKILDSLNELYEAGVKFVDTHSQNLMKDSQGTFKWIDLGHNSSAPGPGKVEDVKANKTVRSSDLENDLVQKLFKKYQEKLRQSEWKVRMDPSGKGILFGIRQDEEHFLVYEIFLMRGQFLILMRKPSERLLGKIQNNFRTNHLARQLFTMIWEDSRQEEQNHFNVLEYPYPNGPLDNRRFKRGGWQDNIVLFEVAKQVLNKCRNLEPDEIEAMHRYYKKRYKKVRKG